MKNKDISTRIDEVISSLDGIKRAEASPYLFEKIMGRMRDQRSAMIASPVLKWGFSMGIAIIICLNVAVMAITHTSANSLNQSASACIYSEYFASVEIK